MILEMQDRPMLLLLIAAISHRPMSKHTRYKVYISCLYEARCLISHGLNFAHHFVFVVSWGMFLLLAGGLICFQKNGTHHVS